MSNETFADGIASISFNNGAIRIDYFSFAANESDPSGTPKRELRQRITMTPTGFLESFTAMRGMVDKLVENGIYQRTATPDGQNSWKNADGMQKQ